MPEVWRDLIAFREIGQERAGIVLNAAREFTDARRGTYSLILSSKIVTLHLGINKVDNFFWDVQSVWLFRLSVRFFPWSKITKLFPSEERMGTRSKRWQWLLMRSTTLLWKRGWCWASFQVTWQHFPGLFLWVCSCKTDWGYPAAWILAHVVASHAVWFWKWKLIWTDHKAHLKFFISFT